MNQFIFFVVVLAVMIDKITSNPCIQTSSVKYACPPFPPQTQQWPGIEVFL